VKAKPALKNLAGSHRAKLLNRSRERKEDFQFVLKGATMFLIWKGRLLRPTRDVDFLGYGSPDPDHVTATIRAICEMPAEDGLLFDLDGVSAEEMREDAGYPGVRVLIPASLDGAKVILQIDIGYGDAVDPAPIEAELPVILGLPPPWLRTYPPEVAIAEKFQAMAHLGTANGAFLRDAGKIRLRKAFLGRIHWTDGHAALHEVGSAITQFLMPVIESISGANEELHWQPAGPWRKL
jgi:hypothetical protein